MTINMKKNAIEMTKKFAMAAAKFGTTESKQLQEARKDYPTFSVVTVTRKATTKKNSYKGLTYEYMEMHIQKHDDEKKSIQEVKLVMGECYDIEEQIEHFEEPFNLTTISSCNIVLPK